MLGFLISFLGGVGVNGSGDSAVVAEATSAVTALRCSVRLAGVAPVDDDLPRVAVDKDKDHCGVELRDPVLLLRGGGVDNAVVWLDVSADSPAPSDASAQGITLTVDHCLLRPRIQATCTNATVQIASVDRIPHNPHGWLDEKTVFNLTLLDPKYTFRRKLAKPGVYRIDCDTHTWMKAYIHVFDHPFFAVTGDGGLAVISSPPVRELTLHVWHEVLGEQQKQVRITAGQTTETEFLFDFRDVRPAKLRPSTVVPWPSAPTARENGK